MRARRVYCDRLMDRPWRTAHPFRPRITIRRRVVMMTLFILFSSVIGTYLYVTDSTRVRQMAESYLTSVLGGPVHVRQATLSIFEGLRLDDVTVHVDQVRSDQNAIFSAEVFKIDYSARAMLRGHLE